MQTKFVCASRPHLEWLKERLNAALCIDGLIIKRAARGGRHDCYTLRYSKVASHRLLPALYRETRAPRLTRKWRGWGGEGRRPAVPRRDTPTRDSGPPRPRGGRGKVHVWEGGGRQAIGGQT